MKECDAVQFPLHRDERARGRALHAPRRAPAGLCTQDIMDIGRMWYHYPFVIELRKKWEARELERVPAARCPASVPAPCPKAHPSTPKCTLMVRAWSDDGPMVVRAWSDGPKTAKGRSTSLTVAMRTLSPRLSFMTRRIRCIPSR